MNCIIKIKRRYVINIREKSVYNHNYYKLPILIDDNNILYEKCQEEYNSIVYVIGRFEDDDCSKKFIEKYFFEISAQDDNEDEFVLDFEHVRLQDFT